MNREKVQVDLYRGVKVDPSYGQLCLIDINNYKPILSMTEASIVKLGNPIRFNLKGNNYINLFNCNYINVTLGDGGFKAFVTDIKYINDGVIEIYYDLDYLNTYQESFENSSLFVNQTTALLDNVNPVLDTPTLDHTAPSTLLGSKSVKATDAEIIVYYADTKNSASVKLPTITHSDDLGKSSQGKPNDNANPFLSRLTGVRANVNDSSYGNKDSYNFGLYHLKGSSIKSGTYPDFETMMLDPNLWNSDGSSKIIRAELHEKYGNDVNTTAVLDVNDLLTKNDPFGNYHNPFYKYILNIGNTTKEIPSRFMDKFKLTVNHKYSDAPGSPDLFILSSNGQDHVDANTITMPVMTTPLVISGTWAKFYKQRNRLNADAQNLVNNINTKIKNFLLSTNTGLYNASQSKSLADLTADVSNKYAKTNNANAYTKTTNVINNNYDQDTQALEYSQNQAKKAIANTLSTSLTNLNRQNETTLNNIKASQANELNNLGKTQTLKQNNLSLNQSVQTNSLLNNFNTDVQKINIQALNKFFKEGAGALLSGTIKTALLAVLTTMITGAADVDTAIRLNDLSYHGGHGADDPSGAEQRLKKMLQAQIKALETTQGVELDNLKASQAVELSNTTRSQDASVYTTQNNANTSYANKLLDLQTQSNSLNVANAKTTYNAKQDNDLANLNADVARNQAKENNQNNYNNSYYTITYALVVESEKLYNDIDTEIKNFNNKVNALIADTRADVVNLGGNDDRGQLSAGLRDITLSVYYQGPDIQAENQRLRQQYGVTVNKEENIKNIINTVVTDNNNDPYIYIKGQNIRGMYDMPASGRAKLVSALERGCKVYTNKEE